MIRPTEENARILLLEDDMQSMQEISNTLHPAGYELHYSIAGHNLTEMIQSRRFDLVLFNLMIEGLNGFEVLKKVKSSRLNGNVPVVFITDSQKKSDLMQGLHISGVDFLKVPYKREELLTRINNQITLLKANKKLEQSRSITKSIQYAERIQKAMTPSPAKLSGLFKDYFLINLPRDIVGGDFCWARKIDNQLLIAVADCTGHGVPGGFLSVLGISLLNELSSGASLNKANEILEHLRTKLKNTLLKTEEQSHISDGMDIALVLIDTDTKTLQFSGAYNRLLISRKGEILEIKGDLQPIGFHPVEKSFTNHLVNLEPGDRIYMTTDGYADQFGGVFGKKLQNRNLRSLIQDISRFDMEKQHTVLLKEHLEWKGINDQVDDILMLGFEV